MCRCHIARTNVSLYKIYACTNVQKKKSRKYRTIVCKKCHGTATDSDNPLW